MKAVRVDARAYEADRHPDVAAKERNAAKRARKARRR